MNLLRKVSDYFAIKALPGLPLLIGGSGQTVILEIDSYMQTDDYSCGATAAFAIVRTFRPKTNFARFYDAVGPAPEEGVGPRRVVSALRKFGVGTLWKKDFGWKQIRETIDQGFPMLIGTGKEMPEL